MALSYLKRITLEPNEELGLDEHSSLVFWLNLPIYDAESSCVYKTTNVDGKGTINIEDAVIARFDNGDVNEPVLVFTSDLNIWLVKSYYTDNYERVPLFLQNIGRIDVDDWSKPSTVIAHWEDEVADLIGEKETNLRVNDLDPWEVRMNPSIAGEYELSKRLIEKGIVFKLLGKPLS